MTDPALVQGPDSNQFLILDHFSPTDVSTPDKSQAKHTSFTLSFDCEQLPQTQGKQLQQSPRSTCSVCSQFVSQSLLITDQCCFLPCNCRLVLKAGDQENHKSQKIPCGCQLLLIGPWPSCRRGASGTGVWPSSKISWKNLAR